jgi:hypothetical protein
VKGADELGAFLRDASSAEIRVAQDAAAHFLARFVDGYFDAMLGKPPGRHQAGQAAAHHGDATDPLQLFPAFGELEA